MTGSFQVIDADGHVEEAHINWKERLPEKYRAMAPERRPGSDGQIRLFMEGKAWPKPSGLGLGVGGPYSRPHPRRKGMTDETELAHVVEVIGDDYIVFASDYSHFDSRFPGASEPIIDNPGLSDLSKRKILNDNARRLYPFD